MNRNIEAVSKKTLDLFKRYSWPGNIRELENVIERGMILTEGPVFSIDPKYLMPGSLSEGIGIKTSLSFNEAAKRHILEALKRTKGKIYGDDGAARILQIKPTTLISKMKRLGIQQKREFN